MITDMIISAFAQQSHITVTGRGRAGSESEIKIMKKMEKSKVYVIKCHLEHLKTHNRGVLGLYLIAPPVMMSYSSRDHGLKVGRLVAPRNNSQDQQQQQRQVNMELLNPYDSDSKALLHPGHRGNLM